MILLVDNYDSFTYNLAQYIGKFDEVQVLRNDDPDLYQVAQEADALVFSPGPGWPKDAGKMEEICSKQNGLNQQKAQYQKVKKDLDEKNKTLKAKQAAIERDQEGIAASKVTLAQDRAESDALLAQLTAQNRMYTEYLSLIHI